MCCCLFVFHPDKHTSKLSTIILSQWLNCERTISSTIFPTPDVVAFGSRIKAIRIFVCCFGCMFIVVRNIHAKIGERTTTTPRKLYMFMLLFLFSCIFFFSPYLLSYSPRSRNYRALVCEFFKHIMFRK